MFPWLTGWITRVSAKSFEACILYIGQMPSTFCGPNVHQGPAAAGREDPSLIQWIQIQGSTLTMIWAIMLLTYLPSPAKTCRQRSGQATNTRFAPPTFSLEANAGTQNSFGGFSPEERAKFFVPVCWVKMRPTWRSNISFGRKQTMIQEWNQKTNWHTWHKSPLALQGWRVNWKRLKAMRRTSRLKNRTASCLRNKSLVTKVAAGKVNNGSRKVGDQKPLTSLSAWSCQPSWSAGIWKKGKNAAQETADRW